MRRLLPVSAVSLIALPLLGGLMLGCPKKATPSAPAPSAEPSASPSAAPRPAAASTSGVTPPLDAGLPFSGPSFHACHKGFYTEGEPRKDVTRLGYLCGPYHGQKAIRPMASGTFDTEGAEVVHKYSLKRGECSRLFVVTASSVKRLHARLLAPSGKSLAEDTSIEGWGVLGPYGVLCADEEGQYEVRLRAVQGTGSYAAQLWALRNF